MAEQIELLFAPETRIVDVAARGTLDERFAEWIAANPAVYRAIVRLAREHRALGMKRLGIKYLMEVARYRYAIETRDVEGWKLNNNYASRLGRMIMDREPDLAGVFELRALRSEAA